jgi:hypothetical protein
MSSQTKLIKDILSTYNSILENKNLIEATDIYSNIDFQRIGHGDPANDDIDTALLQDVQNAAKNANVTVSITTAISGHNSTTNSGNPSRHPTGDAVDIAIINGKAVSPSNRKDADNFVNSLVSMGYVKNQENSSTPKSVLTFGFPDHDNHVHVSNKTGQSSSNGSSGSSGTGGSSGSSGSSGTSGDISTSDDEARRERNRKFVSLVATPILQSLGINEGNISSSFGDKVQKNKDSILIPASRNSKIISAVSGKVINKLQINSCENQIAIEFEQGNETAVLVYCGIDSPSVYNGDRVYEGDKIGNTTKDVTATLYTQQGKKLPISRTTEKPTEKTTSKKSDKKTFLPNKKNKNLNPVKQTYKSGDNKYTKALKAITSKIFSSKKEKVENNLKEHFENKKLEENINRIKRLLK